MGIRFRKRINIAPGIKLNLSMRGISTTFGRKGFSVNVGKNGAFLNTGIPGTGLYSRDRLSSKEGYVPSTKSKSNSSGCIVNLLCFISLFIFIGGIILLYTGDVQLNKEYTPGLIFFAIAAIAFVWLKIVEYRKKKKANLEKEAFEKTRVHYDKAYFKELYKDNPDNDTFLKDYYKKNKSSINTYRKVYSQENVINNDSIDKISEVELEEETNEINQIISGIQLQSGEKLDRLFYEAAKIVIIKDSVSVPFIQRKLAIGLNRTARIVDQLEYCGIISRPSEHNNREVLIKDIPSLNQLIHGIKKTSE